jgi:SAM-dependent methyltransferase
MDETQGGDQQGSLPGFGHPGPVSALILGDRTGVWPEGGRRTLRPNERMPIDPATRGRRPDMETQAIGPSDEQRGEWAQRVESFARDGAPNTRIYAEALVDFVAPERGARALDIATGSGIVAVAAAKRVGPEGSVLSTDFVAEWEPYVAETAREAGVDNVAFAVMPAESLDLPDDSFDVAFCQFGLMFVTSPVQALREMRRVLRPGGTAGVTVWSVAERVGIFLVPGIIAAALPQLEKPSTSPLSLSEPGLIERLAREAGFRDIVAKPVTFSRDVASPEDDWRRWSEDAAYPPARVLATLAEPEREAIHENVIAALERFRDGDVIRVPSEAIMVRMTR